MNGSAAPPLLQTRTNPDLRDEPEQRDITRTDCVDDSSIGFDSRPFDWSPCLSVCLLYPPGRPSDPFSTRPCVCKRCVSNGSAPASHSFANPPKPSFRQAIAVLPIRPSRSRYSRSGRCHGPGYCQLHAARWQLRLALPRIALPCLAYIASKPYRRPVSIVQPNRRHRNRNPVRLQQYGKPVLIDNTHPKPKSEGGIPSHARLSLTTLDNRSLFLSYAPL